MNVIELEQGSVVHAPENGTNFYTTLTLSLSSIGIGISAFALILLVLTACLFAEWRKSFKNQLLIQFMICRCHYTYVRFYFDIRAIYDFCERTECVIYLDEMSMIYTEVALISWMFVFTRQMHSDLVIVFNSTKPSVWKLSLLTWVTPAIVSGAAFWLFKIQTDRDLLIFFIYLASIKWPILVANAVLLIMILRSVTKKDIHKVDDNKSYFRLVIVMNVLIWTFCFQQVFIDVYKLMYILLNWPASFLLFINIATIYHCAFAITFWVFGNADTRKLWRNKCWCTKSNNNSSVLLRQISSISI